jgi:membrane protein CcdC involved in cytochrome C biogenesis
MNWNHLIRQAHRWLGVIFILAVLVATYAAASGQDTQSVLYYLPLPPLFLMMATGIWLFILPYLRKCGSMAGRA